MTSRSLAVKQPSILSVAFLTIPMGWAVFWVTLVIFAMTLLRVNGFAVWYDSAYRHDVSVHFLYVSMHALQFVYYVPYLQIDDKNHKRQPDDVNSIVKRR